MLDIPELTAKYIVDERRRVFDDLVLRELSPLRIHEDIVDAHIAMEHVTAFGD